VRKPFKPGDKAVIPCEVLLVENVQYTSLTHKIRVRGGHICWVPACALLHPKYEPKGGAK
jgi:hypothetical protein